MPTWRLAFKKCSPWVLAEILNVQCTKDQFFLKITAMPVFIDNAAVVSKMRRSSQAIKQRSLLSKKCWTGNMFLPKKTNAAYTYLTLKTAPHEQQMQNHVTKFAFFWGKEKHVSSKKVKAPFRNSSVTFAHAQCGPYHCKPSTNMQSGNSPPTPFFSKGDTPKKNHKPHATSVAHFHHPLVKANFVSLLLGGACPPKSSFCKPPAAAPSRAFCEPPCLWAFSRKYLAPFASLSRATMKVWASFLCKSTEHSTSHWISKEVFYHLNTSHLRSEVGPGPPFPRPLQPGHWSNR